MGFKRHDFDEPDDDAFLAEKLRKGNDLVVVEPAQQHAIYLDLVKASLLGGAKPGNDAVEAPGTCVMRTNVSRATASMLTVTRFRPASRNGCANSVSRCPLLIRPGREAARSPVRQTSAIAATHTLTPAALCSSGSPPVSRTFSIPSSTKTRTVRKYSAIDSSQ